MNRRLVFARGSLYFLLASIILIGCSDGKSAARNAPQLPPALVEISTVEYAQVADEIEASGTLEANESVVITSTVTDIISSVNFDDGKIVKQGDVLVTLSSDEQSAELDEAQANLDEAIRQLARLERIGGTLASKSDIDEARAQVEVNRGRLQAIKARLADRIVTAPFSGVLGIRKVSVGAVVSPGTEIVRLDDISVLNLDFTVPEVYLADLSLGGRVIAKSPAMPEQSFEGTVSFIDRRVDPATRAIPIRAKLPNPDARLFPGMLMNVTLYSAEHQSLVVAESALLQVGSHSSVFVLKDDNSVERRVVKLGKRLPGKVVISEGLQAGERIVINGTLTLKDGAPVRVHNTEAAFKSDETGASAGGGV